LSRNWGQFIPGNAFNQLKKALTQNRRVFSPEIMTKKPQKKTLNFFCEIK